jgi:hypothetical protein
VLDEYEVNTSWKVVVFDDDECKQYFDERFHFNEYKDEFYELAEVEEEWDGGDPQSYDGFIGHCIPCDSNKEYITDIRGILDQNRLESFNSDTKFIQRLFTSYKVDHLIIINDESFSMLLNIQRPQILAHEAFHIVEYETFDQNHKGEEINEIAKKLVKKYIESLTDEERKREFKKISSHRKGRGIYGRLRIITKFK